jgi:hypothetical protein
MHRYVSGINSTALANTSMKHAIKYRREIPSLFPDDKFRKTIDEILTHYEKPTDK